MTMFDVTKPILMMKIIRMTMKVMIMMTQTMPNILMKTIMLVMMLVVVVVMILVVDGFASPVIHYCVFRWEPMVAAMVCRGLPWEPPWDPTVAHV